jgi:hypothetical protein
VADVAGAGVPVALDVCNRLVRQAFGHADPPEDF